VTLEERIDRIIYIGDIELVGEAYKGKYELGNRNRKSNIVIPLTKAAKICILLL